MPFTDYQLSQIKRFASATKSISESPSMLSNRKRLLLHYQIFDETMWPEVPDEAYKDYLGLFASLSQYSMSSRKYSLISTIATLLGIALGIYSWIHFGALGGISIIVTVIVASVLAGNIYGQVNTAPLKSKYNLNSDQLEIAMNMFVAEPEWQVNLAEASQLI